jgi:hypothetical protein
MKIIENIWMGMIVCGWMSSGTSYVLCKIFGDDGIRFEKK